MSEPTRERVRATIGLVGGYWRPLAAVGRLLEELGELAELDRGDPRYASELADLWIITTALSDQFLGAVAEPDSHSPCRPPLDPLVSLLAAAGPIARIVNYYDGPKTPRDFDGWISLSDAIAEFHRALRDAARASDVDLAHAVEAKLDAIPALDAERFQAAGHDPSTALSLQRFRSLDTAPHDLNADARLWGSPDCSSDVTCARSVAADLISFTKASAWERLDAYLIWSSKLPSAVPPHDWLAHLLREVAACDASGMERTSTEPYDEVESHFDFNGRRLRVSLFDAPLVPGAFALLRVGQTTDDLAAQ